MFTFIDMCCGIGAFHTTLRHLGGKCVMACDNDPNAKEMYAANHGTDFEWCDDMNSLKSLPAHDVFCAGFPCTTFSYAGKREGVDNKVTGVLIYKIMALLQNSAKKPKVVILENVLGLLNIHNGRTLRYIQEKLQHMGYTVRVNEYDAVDFGAPMHRARVIITGLMGITGDITPKVPSRKLYIRDILEKTVKGDVLDPAKYVVFPKQDWYMVNGKMFVGYIKHHSRDSTKKHLISGHAQAARVYHIDGVCESITSRHQYAVYNGMLVRFLSNREMAAMMGFTASFKLSPKKFTALRQIANSINIFMLRPVC